MHTTPIQKIFQIDQATRSPGGITSLIQSTPGTEALLRWIAHASTEQTCGALEELRSDRGIVEEIDHVATQAEAQYQALPLILLDASAAPVTPRHHGTNSTRFPLTSAGPYQLRTSDRTLLWSEDLSYLWNTPNPGTWRLAASSPESPDIDPQPDLPEGSGQAGESESFPGTLIRRSRLPRWGLTLELHRDGDARWLDVIANEEDRL